MKRFTELVEQLAEDYGAIYTYGSDLDSLGSGSYGVHNIGHPESLERINQYVENFTKKLYFDPRQAIVELRTKMNLLGLDFDVTQQSANEGVYPLNSFGGSFGKTPDTPHNEWHKSDNITEKLGHGLQLNVDFVRVGDGMYQVEAEIVPTGLDYEDVEESAKMADKDYDGDGKIETGTAEWQGSRDKAIKKAMAARKRKLNTEEVEELDELKMPKTNKYGEYKSGKVRDAAMAGSRRAAKQSNDELVGSFKSKPTGDFDKSRRAGKRSSQRLARLVNVKGREDAANKKKEAQAEKGRQKVGAGKRKRSIVSSYEPEGESLDELKSSTLRSYVTKRRGQVQSDLSTGKHSPKTNKGAKGVSAALSRLDARKQLKGAPKGSQRHSEWGGLARQNPKDKEN